MRSASHRGVRGECDCQSVCTEERGLPLAELAAHGAGWQAHVEDLAAYLEGRERVDWRQRWIEITPSYRVRADGIAPKFRPGG